MANQGVMPGRILGVEAFMMFIATCTGMTGRNKDLLWAALYADDTGPVFKATKLQAIKSCFKWVEDWCKDKGVRFHLSGEKKPVYLAYLKKGHHFSEEFNTLKLCDTPVLRTDTVKSLGVTWKVRPIEHRGMAYGLMIDKYGYECEWDLGRVKMFAYRVQRIKHTISPEYMKLMLSYFLVSYLQFSAAIIWPRSSEKHRKQIRYYYSMALAACLGLSTAEALNLACCNHMAVDKKNKYYLKLLEQTGLPSLEEMAWQNSVSTSIQLAGLCPEWYITKGTEQATRLRSSDSPVGNIISVVKSCRNTLIDTMLTNAKKYYDLTLKRQIKKDERKKLMTDDHKRQLAKVSSDSEIGALERDLKQQLRTVDTPYLERFFAARDECKAGNTINHKKTFETFMLSSRLEFDCLDAQDRIRNFKTPTSTQIMKNDGHDMVTNVGTPKRRRGRPTLSQATKRVNDNTSIPSKKVRVAPTGGKRPNEKFKFDKMDIDKISCKFCDKHFDLSKPSKKSHMIFECTKIQDSKPVPKNSRKRTRLKLQHKRLAEIVDFVENFG